MFVVRNTKMETLQILPLEILEIIAMFFDDPRDYGSFIRLCKCTNEINTEYFRLLFADTILENHIEYQDATTGTDTALIKKEYSRIKNTTIKHSGCVFYHFDSAVRKIINYKLGIPQSQKRIRSREKYFRFEFHIPYDKAGTKHGLGIIYEIFQSKPKQIYGAGLYFKGKKYGLWKYDIQKRKKDDIEECLNDILSFQEEGAKKLEILTNASREDMVLRFSHKTKYPLWTTVRATMKYCDAFYLGGTCEYGKTDFPFCIKHWKRNTENHMPYKSRTQTGDYVFQPALTINYVPNK